MKKLLIIVFTVLICSVTVNAQIDTCANQMPGDVNSDGSIDISDVVYLVSYLHSGGSAPPIMANADVNGDCEVNNGDIIYLAFIPVGGPQPVSCTCVNPDVGQSACCFLYRGNINYDPEEIIDISDLIYLVAYMFQGGKEPPCMDEADVDGSGGVNPIDVSDIIYLVSYMFSGGFLPTDCP